jgi:glycosyltransferase involved in cell wall biosynthesis
VPALPPQPATLRVAVDLRTVAYADSSARGIGQYTVHHLAAVARRDATVQLCCHLPDAIALPRQLELPNVTRRDVDAFAARDCDVVHLPDPMNLTLGFDSPLRTFRHERTTVTFHDLTPLRHYLQAWPERNRLAYLDRLRQIERSDALLLCNSTFTRDDVVATLGIAARRARVILAGCNGGGAPSAADAAAVRRRLGLRGPFVLHVGALDPHKNFAATLSAFLQVRRARELQLVVVGAVDPGIEYFASFCKSRGVRDVVFTGFLPRADLDALYAAAAGLLFLSRSEGFGFPLLEAMAAGCPVVGTDATSHPEVVGDAGQLVPIDDTVAAAAALERLLADAPFAAQCRARGRARARSFTWDAVADRTLAAWRAMGGVASAVDVTAPAIVAAP